MAKIRLTETQLKMLAEERSILDDYEMDVEKTLDAYNIIFSKLIFANVAEIIDNELDLNIIHQDFIKIDADFTNSKTRMDDYFENRGNESSDQEKLDFEKMAGPVDRKYLFIHKMLNHLIELEALDYTEDFSDIETKNI